MIKRRAVVLLLVLSAVAPVRGQDGWTTYTPSGSNFSILVPMAQKVLPVDKDTTAGGSYQVHLYRIRTPARIYIFGWTDYHEAVNVEGELNANRDNFVKALTGKLLGETRIMLDGVSGREFTGENANGFFISRVYASGTRAYQAAVLILTGGTDDTMVVTRFLYSMQLR
ncbi:MAG: hypothetical protein EXQ48_03210 [Acidobacteria bacterium]|nr:hypothetical protein [Acidobacteriota bacterium]